MVFLTLQRQIQFERALKYDKLSPTKLDIENQ